MTTEFETGHQGLIYFSIKNRARKKSQNAVVASKIVIWTIFRIYTGFQPIPWAIFRNVSALAYSLLSISSIRSVDDDSTPRIVQTL